MDQETALEIVVRAIREALPAEWGCEVNAVDGDKVRATIPTGTFTVLVSLHGAKPVDVQACAGATAYVVSGLYTDDYDTRVGVRRRANASATNAM